MLPWHIHLNSRQNIIFIILKEVGIVINFLFVQPNNLTPDYTIKKTHMSSIKHSEVYIWSAVNTREIGHSIS